MERYGIERGNVLAIIELVQKNPVYLSALSVEERSSKLRPLKEMLSARVRVDEISKKLEKRLNQLSF